ncbi:MAG: DUF1731 domain-containing protein [Actinomycetota bacterium]|nr:DUF1731 domain-containing protein [Actinomycetota bacterium]
MTASQRVVPTRLRESGFDWVHATLPAAVATLV